MLTLYLTFDMLKILTRFLTRVQNVFYRI